MGRLLWRGPRTGAALPRESGLRVLTLLPLKNSSQLSAQFLRELAGQEGKSLLGSIISIKTGRSV